VHSPDDDDERTDGLAPLQPWESLAVEAVGNTIDFWRFKRNHGRVWALLYLRDRPLSQTDLQELLGLSKGAASMVVRELEVWGVVSRVRVPGAATWRYAAQTDLSKMIRRVLAERELQFVERTKEDLDEAYETARSTRDVNPQVLHRLQRMRTLAGLVDKALRAFLLTARLDVASALGVLAEPDRKHKPRSPA
jgi:HTH-type transcriptional regulator, glycine betaine synthesis regulator